MRTILAFLAAAVHAALFPEGSNVVQADAAALAKALKGDDVVVAAFTSDGCGHCSAFAPEIAKAAKALQGVAKVLNVQNPESMQKYQVQGYPTVLIFGADREKGKEFEGQRTAQALSEAALREVKGMVLSRLGVKSKKSSSDSGSKASANKPGSGALEVTDASYAAEVSGHDGPVFMMLYAPWCGHCTAMKGDYDQLANNLNGKVKVVKIDATAETKLSSKFGVKGFPTLKMLPNGKSGKVVDYNGGRDVKSMTDFAGKYFKIEAQQLLTQEHFDSKCADQICIIGFLPHIMDSSATDRKRYVGALNAAAKSSAGVPVEWFWSQGGDQFDFEDKLRLHDLGFPAVVALHRGKGHFGLMRGSFEESTIKGFLGSVTRGKVHLQPLPKELPKWNKQKKWDGKDAKNEEL